MMARTERKRRLIALALLLAAVALMWLTVVRPLILGFEQRAERRASLEAQYATNARLISRIPSMRRVAERQAQGHGDYAIAAANAELGGEVLREQLADALGKAGGELRSSQSLEAEPGWLRASASATVNHAQLVDWLERLWRSPPYLSLEGLTVNAERAMTSDKPDMMDVTIEAAIPFKQTVQR